MVVKLTGVEEIDRVFKGLPDQLSHRVIQAANAKAAIPFINAAHRLAPVGKTGGLADSIGAVKVPFKNATVVGEVQAGPRRGRFKGHHAHLLEFGTVDRHTEYVHPIFGTKRGKMTATPFLEPAFYQTKDLIFRNIEVDLAKSVNSFMKRTIKRG